MAAGRVEVFGECCLSPWDYAAGSLIITEAGGIVTGKIAVLAEGGAADRTDIKFLAKLPVFNADGTVK